MKFTQAPNGCLVAVVRYAVIHPRKRAIRSEIKMPTTPNKRLTGAEVTELASLINMIEVVDCFGLYDLGRRIRLEDRATDTQLITAYKMAKVEMNPDLLTRVG